MNHKPTQLRMSEGDKQRTYQAAVAAIQIINQKREALNKYREESLAYAANNPGNYSFTFNMDFMKVTNKLILGYVQSSFANRQARFQQISDESLKIAKETGASYQEVRELFLLLMTKYVKI